MEHLLEKLKLLQYQTIKLDIHKNRFVEILKSNVDKGNASFFTSSFEAFSSSKNEYKGEVSFDGFKIRRRRKMFDVNMNFAIASGKFIQKDGQLIIETRINSFSGVFIFFYVMLILFYLGMSILELMGEFSGEDAPFIVFPMLLIHALFMFGVPYFLMRRSTNRMKYDLERDFYYFTKTD